MKLMVSPRFLHVSKVVRVDEILLFIYLQGAAVEDQARGRNKAVDKKKIQKTQRTVKR